MLLANSWKVFILRQFLCEADDKSEGCNKDELETLLNDRWSIAHTLPMYGAGGGGPNCDGDRMHCVGLILAKREDNED